MKGSAAVRQIERTAAHVEERKRGEGGREAKSKKARNNGHEYSEERGEGDSQGPRNKETREAVG